MYQQFLYQQCVPDEWRQAKVFPLYKGKGDKQLTASYRPISLTAVASKVLERIVVCQVQKFLFDNLLISAEQHGFIPHRSTTSNLLQCDLAIVQHLNANEACDVILLDFAKAFDKVPHSALLAKVASFGIQGRLLGWITDFLRSRSQFISYASATSISVPVASGVCKGVSSGRYYSH